MKIFAKYGLVFVVSILIGALIGDANAASRKSRIAMKKPAKRVASYGGDALKPKTNLKFDGRSVESLRAGKYDSLSLGDEGVRGTKRLYSLPANFSYRAADSEMEMRYRQ